MVIIKDYADNATAKLLVLIDKHVKVMIQRQRIIVLFGIGSGNNTRE